MVTHLLGELLLSTRGLPPVLMAMAGESILLVIYLRHLQKTLLRMEKMHILPIDGLTGLLNRSGYNQALSDAYAACQQHRTPCSLLFMDIDRFKLFNDRHGHQCGDHVLVALANLLQAKAQRPADICARWGGDEFSIVLSNTAQWGALKMAQGIVEAAREMRLDLGEGQHGGIDISVGVSTQWPQIDDLATELERQADHALRQAKQAGGGCIFLYSTPACTQVVLAPARTPSPQKARVKEASITL